MDIEVNGRKFAVRELLAIELDDIDLNDTKKSIKKQVCLSIGLTDADFQVPVK